MAWPVQLAELMGYQVNTFEAIEVMDSETDVTYGVASLWDTWRMDHGSLSRSHRDVQVIFENVACLSAYQTEEDYDDFDEDQEQNVRTYMVLVIDVRDVVDLDEL